jgi:hypothetical protein
LPPPAHSRASWRWTQFARTKNSPSIDISALDAKALSHNLNDGDYVRPLDEVRDLFWSAPRMPLLPGGDSDLQRAIFQALQAVTLRLVGADGLDRVVTRPAEIGSPDSGRAGPCQVRCSVRAEVAGSRGSGVRKPCETTTARATALAEMTGNAAVDCSTRNDLAGGGGMQLDRMEIAKPTVPQAAPTPFVTRHCRSGPMNFATYPPREEASHRRHRAA